MENQDLNVYRCEHFKIQELVSPAVYAKYGNRAWQFFDVNLLKAIDLLREDFGSCTINDWLWNKDDATNFTESGLRSLDFGGIENRSLHKHGKAMDLKFADYTAAEIRKKILANPSRYYMIKGIELKTGSWVHIDTRNVDTRNKFFTFNP